MYDILYPIGQVKAELVLVSLVPSYIEGSRQLCRTCSFLCYCFTKIYSGLEDAPILASV